jgi:hypothetical protein
MKKISKEDMTRLKELADIRRDAALIKKDLEVTLSETKEEFEKLIQKYWSDPKEREEFSLSSGEEVYIFLAPGKPSTSMSRFVANLAQRGVPTNTITAAQEASTTTGEPYSMIMPKNRKKKSEEE